MKDATKIFIGFCAFMALLLAMTVADTVADSQKLRRLETAELSAQPEASGRFNRQEHDLYAGSYGGASALVPHFFGISLLEDTAKVIRTSSPRGFVKGDSVYIVKGFLFRQQPTEDELREKMVAQFKSHMCKPYTAILLFALFALIIWQLRRLLR